MKLLFLLVAIICSLAASAQTTAIELPKEKIEELNLIFKGRKFTRPGEFHKFLDSLSDVKNTASLFPAPGVYNLPQDNMPNIVPDMNKVKQIPNAMTPRTPFKSEIPNAAPEQKPDPKKLKWKPVYISASAVKP
jgi:hypothetical protein